MGLRSKDPVSRWRTTARLTVVTATSLPRLGVGTLGGCMRMHIGTTHEPVEPEERSWVEEPSDSRYSMMM